jgi:hypothetical protein
MERLSILIACLNFKNFTGSELYAYELALGLKRAGCDVAILSHLGGPLTDKAIERGLSVYPFDSPPKTVCFDLIHSQHFPVTEACLRVWPSMPHICSIHSEIIEVERPVVDDKIKRYVAIRPSIKRHLKENYQISDDRLSMIRNPIDGDRFNTNSVTNEGFVLFVGTVDYLREHAIRDVVSLTQTNGQKLVLVGKNKSSYLEELLFLPHVNYLPQTDAVEFLTKRCAQTAGIMLGRTAVEGWLCGKSGWIYDVDSTGEIVSRMLVNPPEDVDEYLSGNVIKKIMRVYKDVM